MSSDGEILKRTYHKSDGALGVMLTDGTEFTSDPGVVGALTASVISRWCSAVRDREEYDGAAAMAELQAKRDRARAKGGPEKQEEKPLPVSRVSGEQEEEEGPDEFIGRNWARTQGKVDDLRHQLGKAEEEYKKWNLL